MRGIVHTHQTREIPTFAHGFVDAVGDLLGLVPLCHIRIELSVHPLSNFGTKSSMGFVEVRRMILLDSVSLRSTSIGGHFRPGRDLHFGTRTGLQKVPGHRTDPETRFVLSHPSRGRVRQYRTPPVASRPLSSPLEVVSLEVVSLEELVELLASCCLRSRPVTLPCISSGCPRYDTSRTAWKRLCRRLAEGLVQIVSLEVRYCSGLITFLATWILLAITLRTSDCRLAIPGCSSWNLLRS